MLAADRQLLDAQLRNELQNLRQLEINNVVDRFRSALTPGTLIAGFCFTGIVELDTIEKGTLPISAERAQPLFYICSASALALALYVTAVSSVGIIFGQRLTVQATAAQGQDHAGTVRELNNKFITVLVALGLSMFFVAFAALAVIQIKDPSSGGKYGTSEAPTNYVTVVGGALTLIIVIVTIMATAQMYCRLHTFTPATSTLKLQTSHDRLAEVAEFYVGTEPPRQRRAQPPAPASSQPAPATERSSLIPAWVRMGQSVQGPNSV